MLRNIIREEVLMWFEIITVTVLVIFGVYASYCRYKKRIEDEGPKKTVKGVNMEKAMNNPTKYKRFLKGYQK